MYTWALIDLFSSSLSGDNVKEARKQESSSSMHESSSNVSRMFDFDSIEQTASRYKDDEFYEYLRETQSSDSVCCTILNILQKLVVNESEAAIVKTSTTIKSLWFAVNQYHYIEVNRPFQKLNHLLIKRKLLIIICSCLNKIIPCGKRLDELLDPRELLCRLIDAIEIDCERQFSEADPLEEAEYRIMVENLNALVYALMLFTQNSLVSRATEKHLLEVIYEVFHKHGNVLKRCLMSLLQSKFSEQIAYSERNLQIIFKMISNLQNTGSQHQVTHAERTKPRRKFATQIIISNDNHQTHKFLKCSLESIVLSVAQVSRAEKLGQIFGFFQKHKICSCNIDLDIIHNVMENALSKRMHKMCLNFIKVNVLRTIFNDEARCSNKDVSLVKLQFKEKFVAVYKRWFHRLGEPSEMIVFLKHIAKIAKYMHVDVQSHLLVDIVLPVFRKEKAIVMERADEPATVGSESPADKLLICSLLIFVCYLKDVTVIKAFFIDENIQHLEDLFVMPQFAYLVSNILKIGVDNAQFLGENKDEQDLLNDRLQMVQLNLFKNVVDALVILFDDVAAANDFKLRLQDSDNGADADANIILEKFKQNRLTIHDIIHISVVYWSNILQIVRSANDEFRQRAEQLIAQRENIVFDFSFNSLSCVLFLVDPEHHRRMSEFYRQLKSRQERIERETKNSISTSIMSSGTLADFEILMSDDMPNYEYSLLDHDETDTNQYFVCDYADRNSVLNYQTAMDDWKEAGGCTFNDVKAKTSLEAGGSAAAVIFSLKNAQAECSQSTVSAMIARTKQGNSVKPNYDRVHLVMESVRRIKDFVSRKYFSTVIDESTAEETEKKANVSRTQGKFFTRDQLSDLNSTKCKKLLMQLFEITLGVLLCVCRAKKSGECRRIRGQC